MGAIALSTRVEPVDIPGTYILRLTRRLDSPADQRSHSALLLTRDTPPRSSPDGWSFTVTSDSALAADFRIPPKLGYLEEGDIIRIVPSRGEWRVLYRGKSSHNVLFVTERCNSRCVMCSQPPREVEDGYLAEEILQAIPLMARDTSQLCITGGEPTLYFPSLLKIVQSVKEHLPNTHLHMLSNGRVFSSPGHAEMISALEHPDFTIAIPLYSDQPSAHDYVVQSKGAFDETILGLLNLARYGLRPEIRFVIHRDTISRMVATAIFIARNLPFASHVALMGLEPTGFARTNIKALWLDPWDYRNELEEAVQVLQRAGLRVSIYNHQLCVLSPSLWPLAAQSISDWKNIYLECCDQCSVKAKCSGFFSSGSEIHSSHIHPIIPL